MTKILVVDDEKDAADSLGMLFEAMGHEVEVGYHGEHALSLTAAFVPHIIFLDLLMPVLDGFEAAREIRSSSRTDHPFIIALTGMGGPDVEHDTRAAGFDSYVAKPADFNVLMMIVDSLKDRQHPRMPKKSSS